MIVIDYSGLAIAALTVDPRQNNELFRHKILNSIRNVVFKFRHEYGEVIIACDCKNQSWRKQKYPFYKATRKKDDYIDWEKLYEYMEIVRKELEEHFPYKVLQVNSCEADDIIGVLAKLSQRHDLEDTILGATPKKFLIVSRYSDFVQLQKYENVFQFNNIDKKFIKPEVSADRSLFEKVVKGDGGDSICNILSPNDSLLTKTKQKSVMKAKLDEWYKNNDELLKDPTIKIRWDENQELINLDNTPRDLMKSIVEAYLNTKPVKGGVMKYLIANHMKLLIENASEF